MPRRLRAAKARRETIDVPRCIVAYLLWGRTVGYAVADRDGERNRLLRFEYFEPPQHARWWAACEREALVEWTAHYPGTRPPAWWSWSAPALRRVQGRFLETTGAGRCFPTGIPYVEFSFTDPPSVESQAAFLDRFGLWLPRERAHVGAAAFEPERFTSWDLTVAPGLPDDDEGDVA